MHAEISPTECRSSSIPVIAFVQALWHRDIVDQARDGFLAQVGDRATV
jgi:6,7-dimethyl-8-ribityllumazine synthase